MTALKDIRSRWLVGAAAGALGIAGVALALPAHAATAVTFYVSPSGSDSNPGTSSRYGRWTSPPPARSPSSWPAASTG